MGRIAGWLRAMAHRGGFAGVLVLFASLGALTLGLLTFDPAPQRTHAAPAASENSASENSAPSKSTIDVTLGGYRFPPYVAPRMDSGGVSLALMDALNDLDTPYRFRFFMTSPGRRFADFKAGNYDIAFLESPAWGWRDAGVTYDATPPLLRGREIYVARPDIARTTDVFDNVTAHRIAGFIGYHYAFADMNNDPAALRRDFDIMLNNNHARNLQALRAGRVDVAVITEAYLDLHLATNPAEAGELAVGPTPDQTYALRALTRPDSPIDAAELGALLRRLAASGRLQPLLDRFKIADDWLF